MKKLNALIVEKNLKWAEILKEIGAMNAMKNTARIEKTNAKD